MNLMSIKRQQQLASESGVSKSFLYNFQSLSGVELTAFRPDIIRIANDPNVNTIEPLGDKTSIPKKWDRWAPNRMENTWDDKVDEAPSLIKDNEQVNPEPVPATPCGPYVAPRNHKEKIARLEKDGYALKDGWYEKQISSDITTLATYGFYTVVRNCVLLNGGREDGSDDSIQLESAFNFFGDYIGSKEDAQSICIEKGIVPELASPKHKVCSVGKSTKDGLWYGWSHRAMYGFCEGSTVDIGHCAFTPSTMEDAVSGLMSWHGDEGNEDANPRNQCRISPVGETDTHFKIHVYKKAYHNLSVENPSPNPCYVTDDISEVPKGRGTWIANNEHDARQMACDFAESVSVSYEPIEPGDLTSVSATKNPLDYGWYRYNSDRSKKYNKHHRTIDLQLDKGEKFGIRMVPRTKAVYLVEESLLTTEFKLTEREATNLLKVCKPFKGSIDKIRVVKGNGQVNQMMGKTNKISSHTGKKEELVLPKAEKLNVVKTKKPKVEGGTSFFGFYKHNVTENTYAYLEEDSIASVKKSLAKFMSGNKNLGSAATIVSAVGKVGSSLSLKLGSRKLAYMMGPVFVSMMKKRALKVLVKEHLPKDVFLYDETVKVPSHDESNLVLVEDVFYGNEALVLEELQEAVIRDKKFTGIFAQDGERLSRKVRTRKTSSGVSYILFVCPTVNKQFIKEAQSFVSRISSAFGKAFSGRVSVLKNESITVTVFLALKKTDKAKAKRSLMLSNLKKNSIKNAFNNKHVAFLLEEKKKLNTGERTGKDADEATRKLIEIDKELIEISNSLISSQIIAFNTPMYVIKRGNKFVGNEILSIDVNEGTVQARLTRDRKMSPSEAGTEVYSLDMSNRLI